MAALALRRRLPMWGQGHTAASPGVLGGGQLPGRLRRGLGRPSLAPQPRREVLVPATPGGSPSTPGSRPSCGAARVPDDRAEASVPPPPRRPRPASSHPASAAPRRGRDSVCAVVPAPSPPDRARASTPRPAAGGALPLGRPRGLPPLLLPLPAQGRGGPTALPCASPPGLPGLHRRCAAGWSQGGPRRPERPSRGGPAAGPPQAALGFCGVGVAETAPPNVPAPGAPRAVPEAERSVQERTGLREGPPVGQRGSWLGPEARSRLQPAPPTHFKLRGFLAARPSPLSSPLTC